MTKAGEPVAIGTRAVDVFLVLGMTASVVLLFGLVVRSWVPPKAKHAKLSEFTYKSWTNASEAHVFLTNISFEPMYTCFQGAVKVNRGGATVESVVACGEVAPHTSVELKAPYDVGDVLEKCSSTTGEGLYKHQELNWDLCSFTAKDWP